MGEMTPSSSSRTTLSAVCCLDVSAVEDARKAWISWADAWNVPMHWVEPTTPTSMPPILNDGPIHNRISEVAGLISHLKALHFIGSQLQDNSCALVVETTSLIPEEINLRSTVPPLPADWEILQLGTTNFQALQACLSLSSQSIPLIRWNDSLWGAFAYLIRQPAARRLSDRYLDAEGRLDIRSVGQPGSYVADRLIFSAANTYTLTDPAVGFIEGERIADFHRTNSQSVEAAELIKCRMADKGS